jgi:hypothetical protein
VTTKSRTTLIYVGVVLAVSTLGVYRAHLLEWYCDDIFITLRYADNFLDGLGFVYNQGERVEGYTHPLWLIILTAAQWFSLDPLNTSLKLGLLSLLGVLLLFGRVSYRLCRSRRGFCFPFTTFALALHYDFLAWSTSGMETMFFTFLLSMAFVLYFFTEIGRLHKLFFVGLALTLAVLTRPDGAVLFVLANVLLAARQLRRQISWRAVFSEFLVLNIAFLALFVPYVLWKITYYGDLLPNSYYAKSANLPYYEQGFYYLWTYFRSYYSSWLLLLGGLVLVISVVRARGRGIWQTLGGEQNASILVGLLAVVVYTILFVARVGGDFMFARFLIPILPLMYFLIEASTRVLLPRRLASLAFIVLLLLVTTVEKTRRDRLLTTERNGWTIPASARGITGERHYYTQFYRIENERDIGKAFAPYFRDLDVTVLLRGQACLAYYAQFSRCISSEGLTDRYIARLPLEKRGRPGHEKTAPIDYLIQEGVDLVFRRMVMPDQDFRRVLFQVLGNRTQWAQLVTYDRKLIEQLQRRWGDKIRYTNFEAYLDDYIETKLASRSREEVLADFAEFQKYYFLHNDDPARMRAFTEVIEDSPQPPGE